MVHGRNPAALEEEIDMDTTSILASTKLPKVTASQKHPTASQVDRFYEEHGNIPFWNVWGAAIRCKIRKLHALANLGGEMLEAVFAKSARVR